MAWPEIDEHVLFESSVVILIIIERLLSSARLNDRACSIHVSGLSDFEYGGVSLCPTNSF